MSFAQHEIVIVTPVYEDLEASGRLFKELAKEFGQRVFVVAVDDGSVRQPLTIASLEDASVAGGWCSSCAATWATSGPSRSG